MGEYKKRVQTALANYLEKQEPKPVQPKKKNVKREEPVVQSIVWWCRSQGWSVDVVESKAVYNVKAQRYISSQAVPGMSDIVGCDTNGIAVYLEIKANGRRATLKEHQRAFLLEKISKNAFAGCFDSIELLVETYEMWLDYKNYNPMNAQKFLIDSLPHPSKPSDPSVPF